MIKTVNVKSTNKLSIFNIPMSGSFKNLKLDENMILSCLKRGASVEEVLQDGSTLKLTYDNYNQVNNPIVITQPVEETPEVIEEKIEETPEVVMEEQVEEVNEVTEAEPFEDTSVKVVSIEDLDNDDFPRED